MSMPVLQEERDRYKLFIQEQAATLGAFDFDTNRILWHYTTGDALLSIIESGSLWATQVSCLNDTTELGYGAKLLKDAAEDFQSEEPVDPYVDLLVKQMREAPLEIGGMPINVPSPLFVSCFSALEDDLSQWRAYSGGENGYSIGFVASGLFNPSVTVVKVNYEREQHKAVAARVVAATVGFFREGLEKRRAESPEVWIKEFLEEWIPLTTNLAPIVKDPAFSSESEHRIVHQLQVSELGDVQYKQKATLMSRHLPLFFQLPESGARPMLPIAKVLVGPGRHKEVSRVSLNSFLRQKGYPPALASGSRVPFQLT